jgi:hypothetical protein
LIMKKALRHLICAFALLLAGMQLTAQAPARISIQGTLKNSDGASVADGTYAVKFRLYREEMGGTHLWEEEAAVEVVGGIYSHYLGSVVPLDGADFSGTLFLGVRIGNFEFIPRTEMTYAPYTFASNISQKVVCSGAVGDIKYSILNPSQFAAVNGDCWVPLDGRPMAGSDLLAQITGLNTLPDVGGAFLRAQEFPNSPDRDPGRTSGSQVGTVQTDELKSHNHNVTDPGHKHGSGGLGYAGGSLGGGTPIANGQLTQLAWNMSNATTGITIAAAGGAETRPVNMNFWVYIRIN